MIEPTDAPIDEDLPIEEPASIEETIASLEKEARDNWNHYLRAIADLDNVRKRQKRELLDCEVEARHKVLQEVLPVVDSLERVLAHATDEATAEGVRLVLRQLTSAFERLDVLPIEAMGQPFDPRLHEAISQEESPEVPGTVVQVVQRGYRSGERLLRPALVVVARASTAA